MKKLVVYICLLMICSGIVIVFWKQELVYALPTSVPKNYNPVKLGEELILSFNSTKKEKPLFVHFFNPECPCSRFNMKHFKSLVRTYGQKVNFIMVVQTNDLSLSAERVKNSFDIEIPCIIDNGKKIADKCGVYSTPQAVIIDVKDKLYYRGNYNKARYCSDKKSDFAQIALDSLLNKSNQPVYTELAT
ncbi:MAG: redoxin domain-containing protein, partial [Bacteroidia bacterium]